MGYFLGFEGVGSFGEGFLVILEFSGFKIEYISGFFEIIGLYDFWEVGFGVRVWSLVCRGSGVSVWVLSVFETVVLVNFRGGFCLLIRKVLG